MENDDSIMTFKNKGSMYSMSWWKSIILFEDYIRFNNKESVLIFSEL